VREAASVTDATAALREALPDVLVSDLAMPGEDGYHLMRRLKTLSELGGEVPAIAVTGLAREADRRAALAAGFVAYLVKPVSPAELVTEVARAAGRIETA
jgi:CheY-like chemotaxis protein